MLQVPQGEILLLSIYFQLRLIATADAFTEQAALASPSPRFSPGALRPPLEERAG